MDENISPLFKQSPAGRIGDAATYLARLNEADIPRSAYGLGLTIAQALIQGLTQLQWEQEQRGTVAALANQSPDPTASFATVANRYEQTIAHFKELGLWPW